MANTMPDDLLETYWKIKREQKQQRLITAQTELLEAQTALLRQARRANSPPYRPPSEAAQRAAKKRLYQRAKQWSTKSHQPAPPAKKTKYRNEVDVMVEIVRLGVLDAQTALSRYAKRRTPRAVSRLREALVKAKLLEAPRTLGNGKFLSLP